MHPVDDITIISKVLGGDIPAYEMLVNRYKDMVFSIVYRVTQNFEDTEEIAQDVFLKAYQALASFKQESKFSTWLYRIAANAAISAVRRRRITLISLNESVIENYTEDAVQEDLCRLTEEEQRRYLKEAMQLLHPQDVLLINMFYTDELSIEEIASVTGLSQANVKVRLHRARKKMYLTLERLMNKQSFTLRN